MVDMLVRYGAEDQLGVIEEKAALNAARWRRLFVQRDQIEFAFPHLLDSREVDSRASWDLESQISYDAINRELTRLERDLGDTLEIMVNAKLKIIDAQIKSSGLLPGAQTMLLFSTLSETISLYVSAKDMPRLLARLRRVETDFLAANPGLAERLATMRQAETPLAITPLTPLIPLDTAD